MTRVSRSHRPPFCQLPRHRQKDAYIGIKNLIRRAAPVLGGRFYTHDMLHGYNGWIDLYFLGAKAPIYLHQEPRQKAIQFHVQPLTRWPRWRATDDRTASRSKRSPSIALVAS